jgi:hypothetical protein
MVGEARVALRFSPIAHIAGAGQLIERFGGVPSLIYERLSVFIFKGNNLFIRVGDVEYVLANTEPVLLDYDRSSEPIEILGVEFAVMGSRLGIEITSQGGLDALLLCDGVTAHIVGTS